MAEFVNANFVPLSVHIKENPKNFRRFDSVWTPTTLILDPDGKERWRLEGYLPKGEFGVNLRMGLARVDVMRKHWADAEKRYTDVAENHPDSQYVPEAVYWRGISRYQQTHDHTALGDVAQTFTEDYQDSLEALKSQPWLE